MKTLKESLIFLTRSTSLTLLMGIVLSTVLYAQKPAFTSTPSFLPFHYQTLEQSLAQSERDDDTFGYPDPKRVLRKSLLIPGWGQVTNKQIWKVPIVYGLLGGLGYYSVYLHKKYHDYRAAYYNLNPNTPDDQRFGPTPDYIPDNSNTTALRENRNFYRNRRDLVYVFIGLSYALNAIDAYVFAHLRSFDVSDDLSARMSIQSETLWTADSRPVPAISLSFNY